MPRVASRLGLDEWLPIERDAQGREIGQLLLPGSRPNPCQVEIFDAEQETTPCRSRKEPGKQRRTEISEVQFTCWAGRIAARADSVRRIRARLRRATWDVNHLLVACSSTLR
jgi:hypothetical protein